MQVIKQLKKQLQQKLPGIKAQYEMLPPSRLHELQKSTGEAKNSAVLLMLYKKNEELHFSLIVRADGSNVHSGQISFPGGKYENFDNNLTNTALREAKEEVGINVANIDVLGNLTSLFIPVSNYNVFPVVAYHRGIPEFSLNNAEVSELLEMPVKALLNDKNKVNSTLNIRGKAVETPFFLYRNKQIWGATAMILSEFAAVIKLCCGNNI